MDWFEKLTGFRETSYHDTRAKLKVEGRQLHSLINGENYAIGELELVSLQTLRARLKSAGGLPGRLKVSVVTGDVRQMHQSPENAGGASSSLVPPALLIPPDIVPLSPFRHRPRRGLRGRDEL